ncbi:MULTISPECIES: hypothetical protein [unclassified Streptomyces]|nr:MULTISPECIES: hypothetical protein [unclassified Streptomyces]MDH6453028.1 hypothetical protein [Streptomyces sp. SAI-119]MDH6496413.1 hypothetical protein [Streptomyces sp. SAI-149]
MRCTWGTIDNLLVERLLSLQQLALNSPSQVRVVDEDAAGTW